jgi:hypothetical protein
MGYVTSTAGSTIRNVHREQANGGPKIPDYCQSPESVRYKMQRLISETTPHKNKRCKPFYTAKKTERCGHEVGIQKVFTSLLKKNKISTNINAKQVKCCGEIGNR